MRVAVLLASLGVLLAGACGDGEEGASTTNEGATTEPGGGAIVIRTRLSVAADPGSEPIATGEVLEGSTLGGSPFCVGGSILDSHSSSDPEVFVIARTITCPDGSVQMDLMPNIQSEGMTQTGSWKIVSGGGAFEGMSGRGRMKVVYSPDEDAPVRETYTGSASR